VGDVEVELLLEHHVVGAEVGGGDHHGEQPRHVHAQRHVVDDLLEHLALRHHQLLVGALALGAQPLQLRRELAQLAAGLAIPARHGDGRGARTRRGSRGAPIGAGGRAGRGVHAIWGRGGGWERVNEWLLVWHRRGARYGAARTAGKLRRARPPACTRRARAAAPLRRAGAATAPGPRPRPEPHSHPVPRCPRLGGVKGSLQWRNGRPLHSLRGCAARTACPPGAPAKARAPPRAPRRHARKSSGSASASKNSASAGRSTKRTSAPYLRSLWGGEGGWARAGSG
jgi:hypothetical protein